MRRNVAMGLLIWIIAAVCFANGIVSHNPLGFVVAFALIGGWLLVLRGRWLRERLREYVRFFRGQMPEEDRDEISMWL